MLNIAWHGTLNVDMLQTQTRTILPVLETRDSCFFVLVPAVIAPTKNSILEGVQNLWFVCQKTHMQAMTCTIHLSIHQGFTLMLVPVKVA
jgi:hypothetical protein